jgi:hypothetical protein
MIFAWQLQDIMRIQTALTFHSFKDAIITRYSSKNDHPDALNGFREQPSQEGIPGTG